LARETMFVGTKQRDDKECIPCNLVAWK